MKTSKLDRKMAAWMRRNPGVAGEVRHVLVEHDDWCRFLRGKGDCNCNPTFRTVPGFVPGGEAYGIHIFPAPPAAHN